MKKLIGALRGSRIQTKLILSFTVLLVVQSLIQSLLYYQMAARQIVRNYTVGMEDALHKDNALVDSVLYAVTTSMRSYEADPDFPRLVEALLEGTRREARQWEQVLLHRYFWDLEDHIQSAFLVLPSDKAAFGESLLSLDRQGDFYWAAPNQFRNPRTGKTMEYLTAIYPLAGVAAAGLPDGDTLYLIVTLRPELIYQYFYSNLPTENSAFFIATRQGVWVYGSGEELSPEHLSQALAETRALDENRSDQYTVERETYIVCNSTSEINRWIAFLSTPVSELTESIYSLGWLILLFNNLISLLVLAILYYLSIRFMRPMHVLAGYAKRISTTGELHSGQDLPQWGGDVGIISDTILQLNTWLQDMMEKHVEISRREQEATVATLEMQLNPHFLFNTLNTINLLAIQSGQKEISRMIVNLSNMMHYTLDQRNRFVSLQDECSFLETYVYLMQPRVSSGFTVSYEFQEEAKTCVIPKMVLQICVENAILHGIRDAHGDGHIIVRGYLDGDCLILQVEDNGRGIPEGQQVEKKSGQIGLANIDQRLHLLFGSGYGVRIVSRRNPTLVQVTVPAIQSLS